MPLVGVTGKVSRTGEPQARRPAGRLDLYSDGVFRIIVLRRSSGPVRQAAGSDIPQVREIIIAMRYSIRPLVSVLGAIVLVFAMVGTALAHHPMGGATPTIFWHGFLSGVGHPIIGIDHFAFVIAVGLASAVLPGRFLLPLAFVVATVAGCLMVASGVQLPMAEMVIAASVFLVGAAVMSGAALPVWMIAALFAIAGIFHGGAYAEAIIGAEQTPLMAYLAAFSLTQYAIAVCAMAVARGLWQSTSHLAVQPRLAGAVIAGVGLTFLVEHVEAIAFATA